jgi:hypothetical protein
LPFVQLESDKDISFENGKASVYLDLTEQASNTFEGVLSLLSNGQDAKRLITGYLNLDIGNFLNSGKRIQLMWNRFNTQSQSLDLKYNHPYVLNTDLMLGIDFSLLKQDSSFVNQQVKGSLGTYIGNRSSVQFVFAKSSGNLSDTSTIGIAISQAQNYSKGSYGLNFDLGDYQFPFKYGNNVKFFSSLALGERKTDYNYLNDTLDRKSNFLNFELKLKGQKILYRRLVLYNQIESAGLYNQYIFTNEAYRLGGLNSLRGFNEKSIFSDRYALNRLELRQYFESSSYFMLFYDQLYSHWQSTSSYPFGLGVGLALNTKNSLFNFAMAVGKSSNSQLDISTAKIHFGYISRF